MKVRLKGINEEERESWDAPQSLTMPSASVKRRAVIARLEGYDSFTYLAVPVEMLKDANIGDEFTIHLEHVEE